MDKVGKATGAFVVLVLIQALWISGCGFHLRGSTPLPPSLSAIYVQHQDAPMMESALIRAFTEQQIKPVQDKSEAQVIFLVSQERYQRRVLSVDATGGVQEYELIYAVNSSILNAKGEPLADPQTLTLRRELRYESAEVVAKAGEEQQLRSEMIADAARQIIRQLQFVEHD